MLIVHSQWGQNLYVVGSLPQLGSNDVHSGVRMHCHFEGATLYWEAIVQIRTDDSSSDRFTYEYLVFEEGKGIVAREALKKTRRFFEIESISLRKFDQPPIVDLIDAWQVGW